MSLKLVETILAQESLSGVMYRGDDKHKHCATSALIELLLNFIEYKTGSESTKKYHNDNVGWSKEKTL